LINNGLPVVFADSDNIFRNAVFRAFVADALQRGVDGSLMTFKAQEAIYSFVETDADGYVVRVREKEVISERAVAGAYMFRRGADFVRCAVNMLIYGDSACGEYYISNVYNWAIRLELKINTFDIAESELICIGTYKQLKLYLKMV
jgi:dTDP-glucose pyrophosphorylase